MSQISTKELRQEARHKGPGFIYVIAGGGYAKIGISNQHPSQGRLANLQMSCPFDLSIFVSKRVAGVRVQERSLHQKYGPFRARGEWFKLGERELSELRDYILSLDECADERLFRVRVAVTGQGSKRQQKRGSVRWKPMSEIEKMQRDGRTGLYREPSEVRDAGEAQ